MLSIMSRNSASEQPRSRPRPPTCSICNMLGHNRRSCHLNPSHMNGENINVSRYDYHDRTHRNILDRQQEQQRRRQRRNPPPQQPPTLSSQIQNELSNIATILQRSNIPLSSSSENNIISKPEDLMEPVKEVFVSENCPICMETLGKTNIITTRCGHQMCVGCFTRNLMEAKSNKCPICRVPVV